MQAVSLSDPAVRDHRYPIRSQTAFWGAVFVAFLLAPAVLYPVFVMKVLCFALFACAFNLLLGFAGMLSFGHAMFFGGASYVCAYAIKNLGFPPEASILLAVAVSAAFGLVVGLFAIRRHGIYFAMVTLALAQLFYFLCLQSPATGGEDGLQNVPRGYLLGVIDLQSETNLYYFVLAMTAAGFLFVFRIVRSPFGQSLKAIRDNENRAISLGYKIDRYKLGVFVISAALAGLAGALKAIVFQLASLTDVAWQMSGEVILITLVGGLGTLAGPLVGAAVMVSLQNYFAELGEWVLVAQGVVFVVVVSVFRRGLVGELEHWWRGLTSRVQKASRIAPMSTDVN
ncbi:branched-chain amino acid ABC transporter permease [Agrobacterium tumefaciens]|nr:branched-chain amino acid ABC transporter permease [Agrobacterium fabrum]NTE84557.1 branched-chain amino acid ABC transporter permease [Agrobacterium tumefaciens]